MVISLAPETIYQLGWFGISNSLFSAFILVLLISFSIVFLSMFLSVRRPSKIQLFVEEIYLSLKKLAMDIIGQDYKKYFSFLLTFFTFVLFSSWLGLLPFVGSMGFIHGESYQTAINPLSCIKEKNCVLLFSGEVVKSSELIPLFRAPTSDLNFTLALAIISVVSVNLIGLSHSKLAYFKKYFDFSSPINTFVGLLELVSELGKFVSFTFRLFGNIFAGEVLLLVITSITYGVATLPFLGLEIFVGLIQALVFFILTAAFIKLSIAQH